ncbi:MAG: ParB/RepB/Spo0J family partition protein [Solirubrobacteraceae bacterium]
MNATTRRGLQIDDPLAPRRDAAADVDDSGTGRLRDLPLEQIHANPAQPRKRFDDAGLASFAESIRERGVLQPIIVRPVADGYELVAGERRWRASQLAGESTIPALVDDALDDAGSLELALIENVVRADLSAIEQARTLATLLDDLRLTATVLAKRLGRSRADIANTIRLLELPDEAIDLIDTGALSKGHGKALLAEPDHDRRRQLARRAADAGWSVRALEDEIGRSARPAKAHSVPHPDHAAAATRLQNALTTATGCEIRATPHRDGYRITLDQAAADRLEQLLGAEVVPT